MARRHSAVVIDLSSGSDEEVGSIPAPTKVTNVRRLPLASQVRPQAEAGLPLAPQVRAGLPPESRVIRPAFESKRAAQLSRRRASSESSDDDVQEISSAQFPLRKTKDGPSDGALGKNNGESSAPALLSRALDKGNRDTATSALTSRASNKDKDTNFATKLALFRASQEAKKNPQPPNGNNSKDSMLVRLANKPDGLSRTEQVRSRLQHGHSAAPSDDRSTPESSSQPTPPVRIGLRERVRLAQAAKVASRQQTTSRLSLPLRETSNEEARSQPRPQKQSAPPLPSLPLPIPSLSLPHYGTFSEDVGNKPKHQQPTPSLPTRRTPGEFGPTQKQHFPQRQEKRKASNDGHPSNPVDIIKRARLSRTSSTTSSSSTDDLPSPHNAISVVKSTRRVPIAAPSTVSQRPNISESTKQLVQLPKTPSQPLKPPVRSPLSSVAIAPATVPLRPRPYTSKGQNFTPADDELLIHLKEVESLSWAKLTEYFPGRKWTGLQSRYSHKFSKGARARAQQRGISMTDFQTPGKYKKLPEDADVVTAVETDAMAETARPQRRLTRKSGLSGPTPDVSEAAEDTSHSTQEELKQVLRQLHQASSKYTCSRNLRNRELGFTGLRAHTRTVNTNIKAFGHGTLGPVRYMLDASGDVSTVAWSPDGNFFAAGAVAVTDPDSMQYNKPRNLVIGDISGGVVRELPDHRIPRPVVYKGDNASESMRKSQDDELYTTVQSVAFASTSKGTRMYSISYDNCLNVYMLRNGDCLENTKLTGRSEHQAPIDLLSVSKSGPIATGCRISDRGSINVFPRKLGEPLPLSARIVKPSMKKFPSALRFGEAHHHQKYLLAGFSCEAERRYEEDDTRDKDGEVCLWDLSSESRLKVGGATTRNVFDITWNANPSVGSTAFAVACGASGKVNRGMHSVVRLYAPSTSNGSNGANPVVELECPAYDINDVIYSPYDDNIIAAGSTDGKVYVWDIRQVQRDQSPLRVLEHASSLSVLPHQMQRWEADTGIRFLSWGADHSRLYSGSSDGVVKCWDPYRSDEDKHIRDVVKLKSAVMSGAFSPDYCNLLVGEDASRLNLLSVGNHDKDLKDMAPFKIQKEPENPELPHDSQALIDSGQIVIRPMGAMPIRQAVRGPNYQERLPYEGSRLQKEAHQSYTARQAFMADNHTESCSLDCGHHVSASCQEDIDALDYTGRFKDRIPHRLRNPVAPGLSALREGLNAKCLECGAVARAPDDGENTEAKVLCERCNFSCFRCQKPVRISRRTHVIECFACKLSWRIGVLGYELIDEDVASEEIRVAEVEVEPKVWDLGHGERARQLGSCT